MDKVAMAGLPLIILIFLLMVARPKTWFNSAVDLPDATFQLTDWDGASAFVLLKNGKCSLALDSVLRTPCLTDMCRKYRVEISQERIHTFAKTGIAGAGMNDMSAYINLHPVLSTTMDEHYGIPIDNTCTELSDWIKFAKKNNHQINASEFKIGLLCDKNEPYSNIKLIRSALKKAGIFKVAIVYNPRPISENH